MFYKCEQLLFKNTTYFWRDDFYHFVEESEFSHFLVKPSATVLYTCFQRLTETHTCLTQVNAVDFVHQ